MDDGSFQRIVNGIVNGVGRKRRGNGNQPAAEGFGEDHHVGIDIEEMGCQEWAGAVHAGLNFIEHEERTVTMAEGLRGFQIPGWRRRMPASD